MLNKCDLTEIFDNLANRLPVSTDGNESFTFTAENLPTLPSAIETGKMYLKKGEHIYQDSFKVDKLYIHAQKETYQYLGLLILSMIFQTQPHEILVKLTHSESDISGLIIQYEHLTVDNLYSGYHTKPFAFKYYPSLTGKHPFDHYINPENLPCFSLTNKEDLFYNDDDWKSRDAVKIFGKDRGLVLFAELLLNAALPQNDENEYELEGESGFRGVGISSAEITLLLPGHIFWFEEHWN